MYNYQKKWASKQKNSININIKSNLKKKEKKKKKVMTIYTLNAGASQTNPSGPEICSSKTRAFFPLTWRKMK